MPKRDTLTRALAVVGTILEWTPLVATLTTARLIPIESAHIDYLMPAELLPAAVLGAVLVFWAATRLRVHRAPAAWGLGAVVALPVASMIIAAVTGLASGALPADSPAAQPWIVLAAIVLVLYVLATVWTGVIGIFVTNAAFRRPGRHEAPTGE